MVATVAQHLHCQIFVAVQRYTWGMVQALIPWLGGNEVAQIQLH